MSNIEIKLRDLAEKWKHANSDAYDVCRDAAEELRVLKLKVEYLEEMSKSKIWFGENMQTFSMHNPNCSVGGWGKGKDE